MSARPRERVPTGRRGRPSKSMIAAALERPFCAYLHKICLNNRLEGHRYCIDHIMNDKTAPYRQCTFVHPVTGRRCSRAAHKVDRRASPLCSYHRSLKPREVVPKEEGAALPARGTNTYWTVSSDGSAVPSERLVNTLASYNEDRFQVELPSIEEIAARHNNADSDTESVDNNPDPLKHASVFTEEELTRTLRDKMIRLRRLYIEQYGHIQYMLKEKRLKYIQAQRAEDEQFGESYSYRNCTDSPDYEKLRAMLRYHKTFGKESLLHDQAKRRKLARAPTVGPHAHPISSGGASVEPSAPRDNICIFSKTPQGCDKPNLPLTPYCRQHILYDKKQVLFRPCAGGLPPCLTPVSSFIRKNRCWLHTGIN